MAEETVPDSVPENVSDEVALPVLSIDMLKRQHLRAVHRIDSAVYPKPWSLELLKNETARTDRFHIVVTDRGKVIGHAGLLVVADEGHVTTVAVDPGSQGQGIARAMLLVLVDRGVKLGLANLTLEVRVSNDRAIELYRRFGFAPAGVRKQYYGDTGEDALVMWANDIDGNDFTNRTEQLRSVSRATRQTPHVERMLR